MARPSSAGFSMPNGVGSSGRDRGRVKRTREYVAGTNVLQTAFETTASRLVLTDAMPLPSINAALRGPHRLVRVIEAARGAVVAEIVFAPRFSYGRVVPRIEALTDRSIRAVHDNEWLLLESDIPLTIDEQRGAVVARVPLHAGERSRLVLTYASGDPPEPYFSASAVDTAVAETFAAWQTWTGALQYAGPYAEAVERSALCLKLLTHAPNGAIVAAPTTSLPEAIAGARNWDYRYTWLRDAGLTVYALFRAGHPEDAVGFQDWIYAIARVCKTNLQVV